MLERRSEALEERHRTRRSVGGAWRPEGMVGLRNPSRSFWGRNSGGWRDRKPAVEGASQQGMSTVRRGFWSRGSRGGPRGLFMTEY